VTDLPPALEGFSDLTLLGSGTLASVYRATEDESGITIALKVFDAALDDVAALAFEDACEVLTDVARHPHICTLRWFGATEDDRPYVATDLCAESLARRVKVRGVIEATDVTTLLHRMAGALGHAHAKGIVHGDVQPSNLLLRLDGRPVLTDFTLPGITVPAPLERGAVTGRAAHAAPEVLQGSAATPLSDVWSLASSAIHLLSGAAPFRRVQDESSSTMLTRILLDPLPDLRPQGIPPWLCTVLEAATAKAPEARIPSMNAFAEAVASRGESLA
jgi:serine/threonine protein kinase